MLSSTAALGALVLSGVLGLAAARGADDPAGPPTITLSTPLDYQVFQRQRPAGGSARLVGTLPVGTHGRLRWSGRSTSGAVPEQWTDLAVAAGAAAFSLAVPLAAGGWYRLEVQALNGDTVVAEAQVAHVGMGEVFIVAGQSNATNYGSERLVPQSGRVAAFDGRVWLPANDPQGGCDGSTGGSFIPAFGDALVQRYGVPIGVASTGQGATSVRQWLPRGQRVQQQPTTGGMRQVGPAEWESDGALFSRLLQRCAQLGPRGFRAVLWHQGESDAGQARAGYPAERQISGQQWFDYMRSLIHATQAQCGWPVPWITAQTTYHVGDPADPEFRAAMRKLWDEGVSQPGPDTDALGPDYRDGVHFNGRGQREHGRLWAERVTALLERALAEVAQRAPISSQITGSGTIDQRGPEATRRRTEQEQG